MYEEILVVTDENDLAELPVRHRTTRRERFVGRLRSVALELLFPTSGSRRGVPDQLDEVEVPEDNASNRAIALAASHGARLHFLYVISTTKYDTSIESAVEPLEEEGETILEHLVEASERAGIETESTVAVGRPLRTVRDYIDEHGIHLVLVNEREDPGLLPRLLGDLGSRLAERTDAEVRVVPAPG